MMVAMSLPSLSSSDRHYRAAMHRDATARPTAPRIIHESAGTRQRAAATAAATAAAAAAAEH